MTPSRLADLPSLNCKKITRWTLSITWVLYRFWYAVSSHRDAFRELGQVKMRSAKSAWVRWSFVSRMLLSVRADRGYNTCNFS